MILIAAKILREDVPAGKPWQQHYYLYIRFKPLPNESLVSPPFWDGDASLPMPKFLITCQPMGWWSGIHSTAMRRTSAPLTFNRNMLLPSRLQIVLNKRAERCHLLVTRTLFKAMPTSSPLQIGHSPFGLTCHWTPLKIGLSDMEEALQAQAHCSTVTLYSATLETVWLTVNMDAKAFLEFLYQHCKRMFGITACFHLIP